MDISALQAFLSVAHHASFSRASEALFITQPAVSKRVANLESELGTRLFNRINKQISLTEAGRQLLPKARDLVNQSQDMQRFASSLSGDVAGTLSLAISHHIALYRMPEILRKYNKLYPGVKLNIRFEESENATAQVERGEIEFAVITLPKAVPAFLQANPVWQDQLEVVVGPDHPLATIKTSGAAISFKSLAQYDGVLPNANTETFQIIQRRFDQHGLSIPVQMTTNNLQSLKMLASAGIGWSLLPTSMLDETIIPLSLGEAFERQLGLMTHRKRSLSNPAKAMQSLIMAQIKKKGKEG